MRAVDYVNLGHYLRDVRESQHISIEQASRDLHIRAKYLQELENGKIDNIPGKVYMRGYIKNYAEYLKLDSKKFLADYEKLLNVKNQEFYVPEASINRSIPSKDILVLCSAALVGLYIYWYNILYDHTSAQKLLIQPVIEKDSDTASKDWDTCLNNYTLACFVDLHTAAVTPVVQFIFIPAVKAPPASSSSPAEDNSGDEE